ncbi:hypothetical protein [Nonomuraea sp. LPB2021202275-12-8]|uniref:hypothetical protein n=1 Tax=Nonomuraea sp. LPB2021202275-12-8 TaxID=3120159 RepID=UPI00300D70E2
MRTEDDLAAALREGARSAPEPDLLAGVARFRRRRSRRRTQFLAAAAVVAVVSASTAVAGGFLSRRGGEGVVSPTGPATSAPTSASTSASTPAVSMTASARIPAVEAGDLWPEALFTMPAKNADGWRYRPITALSATEVLLSAESSFERSGKIEIYDTKTKESRLVTEVPKNPDLKGYIAQTATADGTNVAWFAFGQQADGTPVRDIWTAPLAGGEARLIATRTGADAEMDAIALDGDRVVWSLRQGGVWHVPLAGGTPEELPGGAGLHLISWPWASDMAEGPPNTERNQTKVVNLTSGHVNRLAAPPGVKGLRCGPLWCYGRTEQGGLVQRVDGTSRRESRDLGFAGGLSPYPILDRFLAVGGGVYDLRTGKRVTVDNPGNWSGVGTSSEASTILYWGATKADKPDKFRVLNLAAVPPAQ